MSDWVIPCNALNTHMKIFMASIPILSTSVDSVFVWDLSSEPEWEQDSKKSPSYFNRTGFLYSVICFFCL